MCGIVGSVHADPGQVDQPLVRRMCALIRRRGPDDEGFYFGDCVGLGMRRLSIIDVHAGKQPIHNEDRTVWVVFNGEIYNYRELREDLQKRDQLLAILLIQMDQALGIGSRREAMTTLLEILSQFPVVVNLSIEDHPHRAIFIMDRLLPRMHIDDR